MRQKVRKRGQRRAGVSPKALTDLRPDEHNARLHTDRNLAMIGHSLDAVGAGRSLVIDETGGILAGNATQREAVKRGFKLHVVDVDRRTIVAVRRRDLNEDEKRQLAILDNRAAELAEWDGDMIRSLVTKGADLSPFFHEEELKMILAPAETADAQALDETVANGVRFTSCPKCGERFPL
jgi:hypothetical protein